jgi:hypothetical protein
VRDGSLPEHSFDRWLAQDYLFAQALVRAQSRIAATVPPRRRRPPREPHEDHEMHSRAFAADLRTVVSREGNASSAAAMVRELSEVSPEFERVWETHEVGLIRSDLKRIVHPELGVLELHCQMLFDFDQSQALLVFTATPGSESYEKLQLLAVIGEQRLNP